MNANDGVTTNKQYKDRLFRYIFGAEENKPYLLSLYNAMNGTNYENVNELEITTLEDVIYIKEKNDISFLLGFEMNLYEHQSTVNPNMPLRGMMYFSDLYRQYLSDKKTDIYSKSLVKLPTPKYIVFYNGDKSMEDIVELKLSSAFGEQTVSDKYEWTAIVFNINIGHNQELLDKCRPLYEYAKFVAWIKEFQQKMSIREAVDTAVNLAIKGNFLNGFFKKHREGVLDLSLTEYNEEEFIANRRAEGENIRLVRLIHKKFLKNLPVEECADMLETDATYVELIYSVIRDNPTLDDEDILVKSSFL